MDAGSGNVPLIGKIRTDMMYFIIEARSDV
jgi:hypothetical protein